MNKKKLPKLPHGQGSFSYVTRKGYDYIQFKKKIDGQYIYVYGETVKACTAAMKEKEDEYANKKSDEGTSTENGSTTVLYDGMAVWLKAFKYKKIKAKTYDTLESTLNNQIQKSPIGDMRVSQITVMDIQHVINNIASTKSLSTTKKTYNLLKQYFDYYYDFDSVKNPMRKVRIPNKEEVIRFDEDGNAQEEIQVLSDNEIELLTAELSKPPVPGKVGYRHGYGILFIMWVFCRVGEALALQWKDIDMKKKTINIYKEYSRVANRDKSGNKIGGYSWVVTTTKTKHSTRTIPVCDRALECLQQYKEIQQPKSNKDYVFVTSNNNPVPDQFLNDRLQSALKRAGISTRVTIHGLRHTGVSYFIRHGVSDKVVSELAGHADVGITNRIYYNVINEQKQDAIKTINGILNG